MWRCGASLEPVFLPFVQLLFFALSTRSGGTILAERADGAHNNFAALFAWGGGTHIEFILGVRLRGEVLLFVLDFYLASL